MTVARGFPGVVLIGFMGAGKSSVGRELARRTATEFVDMDSWIERKAGRPIRAIFAEDGEAAFREMEKGALKEILAVRGRVVAAGGGAFLDEGNRRRMKAYGPVLYLEAAPETVLRRLEEDAKRPLLQGADRERAVRELLESRVPVYRKADHAVPTDGRTIVEIADRIIDFLERREDGGT